MISRRLAFILLLLLGLALPAGGALAQGQGGWLLTTADFNTRRVALLGLDADGARVEQDGEQVRVPAGRLVRLERTGGPASQGTADGLVLHLRNGERLHGRIRGMTEEALLMETAGLGEVALPLELLLAAVRENDPAADQPWRQPPPATDEVLLVNGDRLSGYVSAISPGQWILTTQDGQDLPIATEAIGQVRFADPGVPAPPGDAAWRLRLTDGSLLRISELSFAGERFDLQYRGRPGQLPEAAVAWIEQADGPVLWLSELALAEQVHTPYLSAEFRPQVDGLPQGSGRGFIVRSRSRLAFELPGGYEHFRVRYAVPREMSYGNVDVRIWLDEALVHERRGLTAADSPAPVELPLAGAQRLRLEVDYGQGLDVQDVVMWIEPALVR